MVNNKVFVLLIIFTLLLGAWIGVRLRLPSPRTVVTERMERCLELLMHYKSHNDQELLATDLKEIGLTPRDFQEIIDRFLYYRTMRSSMEQAMQLLSAFRAGYDINAAEVSSISGFEDEPFRLDAEILAVFESRPELVKKAFEG